MDHLHQLTIHILSIRFCDGGFGRECCDCCALCGLLVEDQGKLSCPVGVLGIEKFFQPQAAKLLPLNTSRSLRLRLAQLIISASNIGYENLLIANLLMRNSFNI